MKTSTEIKQISAAIVKAQAAIKTVTKEGINTFFKKPDGTGAPYATLDSIIEAIRGPIADNKLAVMQFPTTVNEKYVVTTRVQHESGEYFEEDTPLLLGKQDMQGFGAAVTYGKRFALGSFFNVATEVDDDGNAATGKKPVTEDDKVKANAEKIRVEKERQISALKKQTVKPEDLGKHFDEVYKAQNLLQDPGKFIIPFGEKFKGKMLEEMKIEDVIKNADYWTDKKNKGSVSPQAEDFLVNVYPYLINKGKYPPTQPQEKK